MAGRGGGLHLAAHTGIPPSFSFLAFPPLALSHGKHAELKFSRRHKGLALQPYPNSHQDWSTSNSPCDKG